VLPAYARRMRQVNAALRQVYLCGGNSRRIRGALRPLLQSRAVSRSAISRIVQGLTAQVAAWQARSLAELDLVYLYLDGFHLRVRLGGRVSPVPVLAVLGVQRNGQKVLVHLSLRGRESTTAWEAVCEDLAARGVRAPQLCIVDGSKGLRAAVEQTWPAAAIQRCTVHKLRNLLTTAPKRLHDELRVDYHAIPGAGPDRLRDLTPGREPGTGAGQMQHDPACRLGDPDRELDQPLSECGHLRAHTGRPVRGLLQRLEEDVRRGRQQDAKTGWPGSVGSWSGPGRDCVRELLDF
jgi:Transposase, Mutator family